MFSVTGQSCATGYYSFGHEISHNFGCRHDRGADRACSSSRSHYSFRDVKVFGAPPWAMLAINLAIKETNDAYAYSNINARLRLAHAYRHRSYVQEGFYKDLSNLGNDRIDGVFGSEEVTRLTL